MGFFEVEIFDFNQGRQSKDSKRIYGKKDKISERMQFSTSLIDAVIDRNRKAREEKRLQLIDSLFNILYRLSERVCFNEAYIFGSVTRPYRFSEKSDIDIGFIGLKDEDFFKAMSFISGETGLEVDVIQLDRHRLAEKIMREGIRWTKKD